MDVDYIPHVRTVIIFKPKINMFLYPSGKQENNTTEESQKSTTVPIVVPFVGVAITIGIMGVWLWRKNKQGLFPVVGYCGILTPHDPNIVALIFQIGNVLSVRQVG